MTSCPICQKPVDPLRARAVGVRDGKVVAYCSAECAAKADVSKPTVMPPTVAKPRAATPASGGKVRAPVPEDFDSGPVIEILHEPSSGVVTSARDERRDSAPVVTTAVADGKASGPTAKPDDSGTEIDPREVLGDGDGDDDDDESGDKAPGPQTLRRRRDSLESKLADDWLDDEPADVRPRHDEDESQMARGKGRGVLVTLLVLLALAGGGFAVYKYVYLPRVAASARTSLELPMRAPGSAAVEAAPDPAAAVRMPTPLERATEVLRGYLEAKDSPRVQRQAAVALARTGDAAAIARLALALDKDKLEQAGKLEMAHALARAGDKRGTDVLVAALTAPRRDDKLAAAKMLLQLGDKRGVPTLVTFLEVMQHRLGAAKQLARFADPRAIKALEQIRADDKASADEKADATIALVVAGKTEHAKEVHALLEDPRFNVFAAEALAGAHDEAARPVLVKLLGSTQLRARAARSLRHLAPDHDLAPQVKLLAEALADPAQQKDTQRIGTAEAILMLAGPPSWSERE